MLGFDLQTAEPLTEPDTETLAGRNSQQLRSCSETDTQGDPQSQCLKDHVAEEGYWKYWPGTLQLQLQAGQIVLGQH